MNNLQNTSILTFILHFRNHLTHIQDCDTCISRNISELILI